MIVISKLLLFYQGYRIQVWDIRLRIYGGTFSSQNKLYCDRALRLAE